MGFTTGFTGGVTLTLGLAYLTVLAHERNRQAQASNLRSQSRVLTSLLEPTPLPPLQSRAELAREERSTLVEAAKDRWNEEIENAVRWVQRTDWGDVREGMEGAVARLMGKGLEKSREGIEEAEKSAGPKVQEAVDRSKAAVEVDRAAAGTIAGAERAGAEAKKGGSKIAAAVKAKADQAVASTKEAVANAPERGVELADATKAKTQRVAADADAGVHEAVRRSGGTVDAARGAVRDAVSKGIEKGKEAIGKAQAYVGLVEERIESKGQSSAISHSKAVEKALHERYEQPKMREKTVEEALEERYKPIDQRDNTTLRGV